MDLDRYIRISKAIRPAHYNEVRFFHTTFILNKSQIVSCGINKFKTHSKNVAYNTYISREGVNISDKINLHAELVAILALGREDCSDLTFLNVRLNIQGQVRYSAPCAGCMGILNQVGFRRIYYSQSDGTFGEIKS